MVMTIRPGRDWPIAMLPTIAGIVVDRLNTATENQRRLIEDRSRTGPSYDPYFDRNLDRTERRYRANADEHAEYETQVARWQRDHPDVEGVNDLARTVSKLRSADQGVLDAIRQIKHVATLLDTSERDSDSCSVVAQLLGSLGIPMPPVPSTLRAALQEREPGRWDTRDTLGSGVYGPGMSPSQTGDVLLVFSGLGRDSVALSIRGYGSSDVNLYAITYHLVYRGLALFIQDSFSLVDHSTTASVALLFRQCHDLVNWRDDHDGDLESKRRLLCVENRICGTSACGWLPADGITVPDEVQQNSLLLRVGSMTLVSPKDPVWDHSLQQFLRQHSTDSGAALTHAQYLLNEVEDNLDSEENTVPGERISAVTAWKLNALVREIRVEAVMWLVNGRPEELEEAAQKSTEFRALARALAHADPSLTVIRVVDGDKKEVTSEWISLPTCHRLIEFMLAIRELAFDLDLESQDRQRRTDSKVAEFMGFLGSLVDDELDVSGDVEAENSRRMFIEVLRTAEHRHRLLG